jgi:hypothetical protein
MFSLIWKKYLPVIIILLKKVKDAEQMLPMNVSDFERASGGKKVKFSFPKLEINNGKLNTQIKTTEIAKDLAQVLISHSKAFEILTELKLNFSLTNDCVLTIKNLEEVVEEATAEQETLPETVEEKESVD